jgi:hypothetical protein
LINFKRPYKFANIKNIKNHERETQKGPVRVVFLGRIGVLTGRTATPIFSQKQP